MALELEAKMAKIFPELTGEGKNGKWVKQEFLVETSETYPKKILFSAWGERAEGIKHLSLGDTLKISFFAESREFNERWYTELRVWKVEKIIYKDALAKEPVVVNAVAEPIEEPIAVKEEADDLPF